MPRYRVEICHHSEVVRFLDARSKERALKLAKAGEGRLFSLDKTEVCHEVAEEVDGDTITEPD